MIIEDYNKNIKLEDFLIIKERTINSIDSYFGERIESLIELYHITLRYSIPFFEFDEYIYGISPKRQLTAVIFENNNSIISLFDGIFDLIKNGNYLAIKVIQRSIFEFLIINNHLILTEDSDFLNKWISNKDVKIIKNILKKTDNIYYNELIDFWVKLSHQNHASPSTSQDEFEFSHNFGHYLENMFLTYTLLHFYNYQLRELYFPFLAERVSLFKKIKIPFKSNWFDKKDKLRMFEKENVNDKLRRLVKAFEYKWNLRKKVTNTV